MPAEQGATGPRAGLFASLKGLLAAVVANGRLRLSLFATEFEEEKWRLIELLIGAFAMVFLLGLGMVLALVFLAMAFWEQRLLIFGLATGFVLLIGGLLALRLLILARRPTALFRASLHELDKDLAALRRSTDPS